MSEPVGENGISEKIDASEEETQTLGMILLVSSLSILFVAGILIHLLIRLREHVWPPHGAAQMPSILWLSTAIILLSAWTMRRALTRARAMDNAGLRSSMAQTTILGAAFLCNQVCVWYLLMRIGGRASVNMYSFGFYFLSGLHAAHVVAALIWLVMATRRVYTRTISPELVLAIRNCGIFWHFLGVAWIVLFVVVLFL